jgi:hypothetical protein
MLVFTDNCIVSISAFVVVIEVLIVSIEEFKFVIEPFFELFTSTKSFIFVSITTFYASFTVIYNCK